MVIDIIVLAFWHAFSQPDYSISNPYNTTLTTHTEIFQIAKCDGKYHNQFLIGIYCYKGVLLVFGLFLAWQTTSRGNKGNMISASSASLKGDHTAILNTVLVSVVGVICVTLLDDTKHRHALYAIVALCVILCTAVTLVVISLPKVSTIEPYELSDTCLCVSKLDDKQVFYQTSVYVVFLPFQTRQNKPVNYFEILL